MSSLIGFYSLVLSSILSFLITFFLLKILKIIKYLIKNYFFSFIQFFLVSLSFLSLIVSFVNSDFSNETVFNHSHTTKPLFYKISEPGGTTKVVYYFGYWY